MARLEHHIMLGGRYRLVDRLAAGGMGTVWRAVDTVLDRRVAVKVLSDALAADGRFVERFRREARAAAGLSHPHVAGVFDYGEDQGVQFMVMELIDGETLAERIRREAPLDPREAARIAADVAEALHIAHRSGVVHRDVKPSNVMLTGPGDVKVMDFGIAATTWGASLTTTGVTMGTAAYISPEQASGAKATPASDVYSLGVVLYEMLVGRPPFVGESPLSVAAMHANEEPRRISEASPGVPRRIAEVVDAALAKDPSDRPESAAVFAAALRGEDWTTAAMAGRGAGVGEDETEVMGPPSRTSVLPTPTPIGGPPLLPSPRPRRKGRRTPPTRRISIGAVLVGLLVLALLGAALAAMFSNNAPLPQPDRSPVRSTPAEQASTVTVPEIVGLRQADAESALEKAGLAVGDIREAEGEEGVVVDSVPPEGASVEAGSPVTLYVGRGEERGGGADHGKGPGKGKEKGKDEGHD